MQELAALLLLKLAGKDGSSDEITAVITAAGKEVDAAALETLLKEVGDSDINELLASGMDKLKDVKMGGGGGGGGAGGAGGAAEEAEEEKEEEEEEEMDLGGGMDVR
uniref:60S acidic ribosomal protein P2 n=1 Tax=Leptocylindrus danicus TaxID=163516 RepID=A0A7S2LUP1_9STRA|mmetsp:Transcript_9304/g.14010  ORF Transcript_9304/g.14010 Transcript_9304/m.14010 type:complete len:107 (+) Transcript_9304:91-411(+)